MELFPFLWGFHYSLEERKGDFDLGTLEFVSKHAQLQCQPGSSMGKCISLVAFSIPDLNTEGRQWDFPRIPVFPVV